MPNITQNPDYQLVMKFLQNIRPGDMDQESSEQLMMIGQRIQSGGALSDREREMFEAVVGNMPQTEMSYQVDGGMERMSPEAMDSMVSSGQISQGEAGGMAPPPMPSQDGMTYGPSSGVTVAPSVMAGRVRALGLVGRWARGGAGAVGRRRRSTPTPEWS